MARRRLLPSRRGKAAQHLSGAGAHAPIEPVRRRRFRPVGLARRGRLTAPPLVQAAATPPQLPPAIVRARRTVPVLARRRIAAQVPPAPVVVTAQALPPQPTRHRVILPSLPRRRPVQTPPGAQLGPVDESQRIRVKPPLRPTRRRPVLVHLAVQGKTHVDQVRPKLRPPRPARARLIQPPWTAAAAPSSPTLPLALAHPAKRAVALLRRTGRSIPPPWPQSPPVNPPLVPAAPRQRHPLAALVRRRPNLSVPPAQVRPVQDLVQRTKFHPAPSRRRTPVTAPPAPDRSLIKPPRTTRAKTSVLPPRRSTLSQPPWKPAAQTPALVFDPSQRARPRPLLYRRQRLVEGPVGPYVPPVHQVLATDQDSDLVLVVEQAGSAVAVVVTAGSMVTAVEQQPGGVLAVTSTTTSVTVTES